MNTKPTILVLGATGKVGAETVRILSESGDINVVAGVRYPEKAKHLENKNIEVRHLDLDRQETLISALTGIDRALLIKGYSVDMLKQSKAFLDTAKQTGVQHIVHIGASGAPTNEVAHWGWHQFIERYIEVLGFSFTHLRPEAFMQNLLSFGWLDRGVLTNYIDNARWSWLSCDDLALVAAETLLHPDKHQGQIYPLGYDAATMPEIADLLTELLGQPFQIDNRTPEEFLETVLKSGADPAYMHCVYNQLKLNVAGAIPQADATFDNFESIAGKKPTDWKEFINEHREELKY